MQAHHAVGLLSGVILAGSLLGCDAAADKVTGPDPKVAAEALASALSSGTFTDVAFVDATPADVTTSYDKITEGLGELTPTVSVEDTRADSAAEDSATATLTWTWPVGDQDWTYATEALLKQVDDTWQVDWRPVIIEASLGTGETLDLTAIAPKRGSISGARGLDLVTDRPVIRLGLDRSRILGARAGDSARALARLADIEVEAYVKRVEAAGAKQFVEAIVYRSGEVPPAVGTSYADIAGVVAVPGNLPLGPTRGFAAPILGTVGEVTAEMIDQDPERYQIGDQAGLSGLQARYDDQLQGVPGVVVNAVGSDDKERELFRVEAQTGQALKLTMDVDLQTIAEGLLADIGPASALVALRPSTGAIVAAANGPGNGGYNMATFGQFAPGSTFKAVSSLALLRAGLTPDTVVPCRPTIVVDGKSFKNYSDYPLGGIGQIPLRTALANSCNTAFISQADKIGGTDLFDAAVSLGLGLDHDLGFPAYFGSVEPPSSQTGKAADLIGQGTILASPMVMATVIASVQKGELVIPRLVESVDVSAPEGAAPLAPGEATALKNMLRGVVTSGSASFLADVPGPPVLAKTGTAEFESEGKVLTHAWMIAAQGDLAVAVFVDIGASGSSTAGPILEAFLRAAD